MIGHFRRDLFMSVSIIILTFILFSSVLFWLGGAIHGKVQKILDHRAVLVGRTRSIEALSEFKQVASDAKKYKEAMDMLLPAQDGILDFRRWLDDAARAHHVVAHFAFQGDMIPATDAAAGHITISLNTTGSYDDLQRFLVEMERTSRQFIMTFDTMNITGNGAVPGGEYQAAAQGQLFFR